MYIQELWRYPVKSLAGEPLQEVELTRHGLLGDRVVHGRDACGRVVTARTKPHLLGLHGTWDAIHREPLIDGHPWHWPAAAEAVRRAAGASAYLFRIEVAQVRGRCVMTTYDPDTQEQDLSVLRRLVEEFDGRMALDCAVIQSGRLTVGAPVALL